MFKLLASSRLPEPDTHKYVQLIEYTLRNPSFKPGDACTACKLSEKEFAFVAPSLYSLSAAQSGVINSTMLQEWILRPEAYFSYLQYLEFRHAIETARRAYWLSVAAIVISILGVAVALGCTEVPLIINDSNSPLPTLDSTRLLALAALHRAAHAGETGG